MYFSQHEPQKDNKTIYVGRKLTWASAGDVLPPTLSPSAVFCIYPQSCLYVKSGLCRYLLISFFALLFIHSD